jgi:LysR family glycine cleavage system transcriptional activator
MTTPPAVSGASLRRLPPLTSLRAFVVAARQLSFTAAADELFVTPAAVGQQIRQLEAHLGRPLFRRVGRSLQLTEDGRDLLPGLARAFETMVETLARLGEAADAATVRVSVPPAFAAKWLVPRLADFSASHPGVGLSVAASMALVDFAREEADCAVRYGAGQYPGMHVTRLMTERVVPVCAPTLIDGPEPLDHPRRLAGRVLLHDDELRDDPGCPDWRMWLRAAGIRDIDVTRGPRFDQSNLAIEAAIAGQGVALTRLRLAEADLAAGRLVRPFGGAVPVDFAYWFVCPPERLERPPVQAFAGWLVAHCATL